MKAYLLIFALATAFASFSVHAEADEKEMNKSQVPQAVLDAFAKTRPNAKIKGFEGKSQGGKTVIEIEFKENGVEFEYIYSSDGTLLEIEQEIKPADLPQAVFDTVKTAHPTAKIKEATKILLPDGIVSRFEIEIKRGGKEFEVEIDPNGKILKSDKD